MRPNQSIDLPLLSDCAGSVVIDTEKAPTMRGFSFPLNMATNRNKFFCFMYLLALSKRPTGAFLYESLSLRP